MARWLRLFDFEVVHVPGTKTSGPDGLSRRPPSEADESDSDEDDIERMIEANESDSDEDDIERMIAADIFRVRSVKVSEEAGDRWLWNDILIEFLTTLKRPNQVPPGDFRQFKLRATKFLVFDGTLFRRKRATEPPSRVIFDRKERLKILEALHDDAGHRGREAPFRKIIERYWWPGMYDDVRRYV